jgi:hypothetical protein
MAKPVPAAWAAAPDFDGPPFMAIGDSLINGVQSMTIDGDRAAKGPCALVADALGHFSVRIPDYRGRALVADVEKILRKPRRDELPFVVIDLLGLKDEIFTEVQQNTLDWIDEALTPAETAAEPLFHDILGLAGATVDDVLVKTYADWLADIEAMAPSVRATANPYAWRGGDGLHLGDLHKALNAVYLMNPARLPRDELTDLTLFDIVEMRQPATLVVNMGANHGIFEFTLNGRPDDGRAGLDQFVHEKLPAFAARMSRLGPNTERILFWTFPRPSQVPNQMPPFDDKVQTWPKPQGSRIHFFKYEAALPIGKGFEPIDGGDMSAADRFCDGVARRAASVLAATGDARLYFLDIGAVFEAYDSKHYRDKEVVVLGDAAETGNDTRYTNLAFLRAPVLGRPFVGGLGSLDQHHPSTVGYQVLATEILRALVRAGASPKREIAITDRGDPLLNDPPRSYFALLELWQEAGRSLDFTGDRDNAETIGELADARAASESERERQAASIGMGWFAGLMR